MKNSYDVLQLPLVIEEISRNANTIVAKEKLQNLLIIRDPDILQQELSFLDEYLQMLYQYGNLPIQNIFDCLENLEALEKGIILSIEDLYHLSRNHLRIKSILEYRNKNGKFPLVYEKIDDLSFYPNIISKTDEIITNNLEIYDNASPQLNTIRKSLKTLLSSLKSQMENYILSHSSELTEPVLALRNDRYVILLKEDFKNKYSGIIHGYSSSKQTIFFEPDFAASINTKIEMLKYQENEEISKILRNLGNLYLEHYTELVKNENILYYLDFVSSKAIYGKENLGIVGKIVKEKKIFIKKGRHPLINPKLVVSNNVELDNQNNTLLITGPNTGGKTVYLKMVGLLTLMHLCALPVLAIEAEFSMFDNIYTDIGDEQSIMSDLSTFSSHIYRIQDIITSFTSSSLVLIDELGVGTDPSEGEALAVAIIEKLHSKNAISLITTHYSKLKKYAIDSDFIVNASMEFDVQKLQPSYQIHYNTVGNSYAFLICQRLGIDSTIIKRADEYLQSQLVDTDRLMTKLGEELTVVAKRKEQLEIELNDISLKNTMLDKELENAKNLNIAFNNEKKKILAKETKELQEEFNEIINELKEKNLIKQHEINAYNEIINKKNVVEEDEEENDEFKVGDYVFVPFFNIKGQIENIQKDNVTVISKGKKYQTQINKIRKEKVIEEVVLTPKVHISKKPLFVKTELNLIGQTVAEALGTLDKYLSEVLEVHMKQVRIIHGFGTGALRRGIHEHLKTLSYVDHFTLGGMYDGGSGATIVFLK